MNSYGAMKPLIDNDDADSASYIQGPIEAVVSRTVAKGVDPAHPELDPSHRDARILRIAAAEQPGGEYTSVGQDGSNPHVLEEFGASHWNTDALMGGPEGERCCYLSEHT